MRAGGLGGSAAAHVGTCGGDGVGRRARSSDITLGELRGLPADPVALKDALARRLKPGTKGVELDTLLFEMGVHLVSELPVSSEVRAAAYRLIAGLPGVVSTGAVTDALGRQGRSVAMGADGSADQMLRLVIDPADGLPLAVQHYTTATGEVVSATTVTRIGWTDDRPDLP
ncbi:hypothetical protein [Actinocorallia sp. A-T 12471]|uniref:hypothetical protein n=1 Tax=Actinocorallia sp. A-T 12471 TaxID=3089813 RepID=UPI0029CD5B76|nr:hypothetical protein [Actinocorallia sp. A-T 12471]MDX6742640.1 hypothetical protein [Actinocorallia sp. A-T 12471]